MEPDVVQLGMGAVVALLTIDRITQFVKAQQSNVRYNGSNLHELVRNLMERVERFDRKLDDRLDTWQRTISLLGERLASLEAKEHSREQ